MEKQDLGAWQQGKIRLSRCSLGWKDPERWAGFVLQGVQIGAKMSQHKPAPGRESNSLQKYAWKCYWGNKEEFFLPWYLIRSSCSFCRVPAPALTHPSSDGRPSSKHHPGSLSLPRPSGCHYPLKNPIAVWYVDTHQSLKTTGLPTQDPHQLPRFLPSPWKVIVPFHCLVTRLSLFKPTEIKHLPPLFHQNGSKGDCRWR